MLLLVSSGLDIAASVEHPILFVYTSTVRARNQNKQGSNLEPPQPRVHTSTHYSIPFLPNPSSAFMTSHARSPTPRSSPASLLLGASKIHYSHPPQRPYRFPPLASPLFRHQQVLLLRLLRVNQTLRFDKRLHRVPYHPALADDLRQPDGPARPTSLGISRAGSK